MIYLLIVGGSNLATALIVFAAMLAYGLDWVDDR